MTPEDLGDIKWAAGLWEGEGTIVPYHPPKRPHVCEVRMILDMTDKEPIEAWAQMWGGPVRGPYRRLDKTKWADHWRWQTGRWSEAERIGFLIRPFLYARRRKQLDDVLVQFPDRLRGKPPRLTTCPTEVIPSQSGYMRHWNRKEKPCDICQASRRLWMQTYRAKRRSVQADSSS